MTQKRRARLGLPLLLGAITFLLILLALWPQETPTVDVVVAARDLGAGAVLSAADLSTITQAADLAPAESVSDVALLIGQTLAVVRYQGEAVSVRHLGQPVTLQPHERAVSLRVEQDQGLGGILRPGMYVGVVATLTDANGDLYAKAVVEDLRVLYVSPEFQARPQTPISGELTVESGQTSAIRNSGGNASAREGVVIVAAAIDPAPITYAPITETLALTYTLPSLESGLVTTWQPPQGMPDWLNADVQWATPVELLAALNAAGRSFSLVLMPEMPEPYISPGLNLLSLAPTPSLNAEAAP
ncbi:MAG: Flp pilus assembly protein CpaB [Caldilineales bacterium]|nr:Flp pilus assembly protein CpaB [Caldilineales bacterium]